MLVADARKARRLMGNEAKNDALDAELLARIGRADPKLLKPVKLRKKETQCALANIRSRDALVSARTQLVNFVRGTVKTLGCRMPRCTTATFHRHIDKLPDELTCALEPTMQTIEVLTAQIAESERRIEALCDEVYPETAELRAIKGVGAITALAYVLTLETPQRFAKSRQVGAYVGLCPKRWQSGDSDPDMRITRAGDALLRRLLINCAHYIIGPFGPDSDLRRWGLEHAAGGKSAKKRAVTAVARKLAVLLHHLWVTGKTYAPLYQAKKNATHIYQLEKASN